MDEKGERADAAELKRPDEAIKDLEPDEQEGEAVTGGAFDAFLKYDDSIKEG